MFWMLVVGIILGIIGSVFVVSIVKKGTVDVSKPTDIDKPPPADEFPDSFDPIDPKPVDDILNDADRKKKEIEADKKRSDLVDRAKDRLKGEKDED